jgi:type I restriction enzyme M protein
MAGNNSDLEKRLWSAADELRANSKLKASEYSVPVLGLIFLRYAGARFDAAQRELQEEAEGRSTRRKGISKSDYQARGVLYVPEAARFSSLANMPEGANVGKEINDAMRAIEEENDDLKDVLPKTYNRLENSVLRELIRIMNSIDTIEGDAFGKIYEYFLGHFALSEGQRGGEFFTPTPIVKLIVEILEPFHGYLLDPACGSGGMFVQSADFIHRRRGSDTGISIYGQERVAETVRLCRMNLAVHGLHGDIKQGNSYYEDNHNSPGRFDYVMANPPFNVDKIDKERLKDDTRHYPFGMPRADNGNYLWIQLFYSSLNARGRAGFVMANSASDARQSEGEIRQKLVQAGAVDVMVAVSSNFFYNVTLPVTLWFLDKGKGGTPREDEILFIDARDIYRQIDRAHREFTEEQVQLLANIVRLYRGEELNGYVFDPERLNLAESQVALLEEMFASRSYCNVPGLCKVVNRQEIEGQNWSLNPGRYVGIAKNDEYEMDFDEQLSILDEEFGHLNSEANSLEEIIRENVKHILNGGLIE